MPGSALFHKVFFAAYGYGPYECFFCREAMTFQEMSEGQRPRLGCVHHIDEDKGNNHPYNLAACHLDCHNGWHNAMRRGIPRAPAMQERLRTMNVGRRLTPEHKAKITAHLPGNSYGRGNRGKPKSPETRAKMSAARKAWWERKRQ